jgi:hypothetical protein
MEIICGENRYFEGIISYMQLTVNAFLSVVKIVGGMLPGNSANALNIE